MHILIYASPDWLMPSGFSPNKNDRVSFVSGHLADMADTVVVRNPDVLLVAGFLDATPMTLQLERVCQRLSQTAVLPVCASPEPEFLLRLMQIGVREVLSVDPAQWGAALNRARARTAQNGAAPKRASLKVGFISAKGGDGSTSVAVNMAAALAKDAASKVLLIDLSLPFGDADVYLTSKPVEHDLADFCNEVSRLDDALLASMVTQITGNLHFMASPTSFEKIMAIDPAHVAQLLAFLATQYSFVLIDMGSSVAPVTLRLWEQLDQAVIVSSVSMPALRRLNQIRQLWENLGLSAAKLNFAMNRVSGKSDMELAQFERIYPQKPLRKLPADVMGMKASVVQGMSLVDMQPRSDYARAVSAWAAEWLGQPLKEKSLWQRLKKK
ncbi:MAG: AAA family ATPase [Limnohabitans sp.]